MQFLNKTQNAQHTQKYIMMILVVSSTINRYCKISIEKITMTTTDRARWSSRESGDFGRVHFIKN